MSSGIKLPFLSYRPHLRGNSDRPVNTLWFWSTTLDKDTKDHGGEQINLLINKKQLRNRWTQSGKQRSDEMKSGCSVKTETKTKNMCSWCLSPWELWPKREMLQAMLNLFLKPGMLETQATENLGSEACSLGQDITRTQGDTEGGNKYKCFLFLLHQSAFFYLQICSSMYKL